MLQARVEFLTILWARLEANLRMTLVPELLEEREKQLKLMVKNEEMQLDAKWKVRVIFVAAMWGKKIEEINTFFNLFITGATLLRLYYRK